jgi:deoxyribodipyrimidine photo-lyase
MTQLVWFRNDLRVRHEGLNAALATGEPVCALYCLCPRQWDAHSVGPARRWFVLESLRELGRELAKLGVPLFIQPAGDFQGSVKTVHDFVRRNAITDVYATREYPLNELRRDQAVAESLEKLSVRLHGRDEAVLVPPRSLRTGQGTPYTVFTPYGRAWRKALQASPPAPPQRPQAAGQGVRFEDEAVIDRALEEVGPLPPELTAQWQPGEAAAWQQLHDFADNGLAAYDEQRNYPAVEGTSRLSAALSVGTLSPVSAWWLAHDALHESDKAKGADVWITEIAWRDFYRQIMANFPALSKRRAFRAEDHHLKWSDNEQHFRAWCEGRTGYPLVDAAMRQLVQTGWMHNRLRMVVAMFLTKHLFIDWRRGEDFFMHHLVDGDFASNNGGWQWSASVGTDAAPYFRVFNPVRQSQRFDPEGRFIARFLPELAELDNKSIHEPWKKPLLAPDYPAPVVEHKGIKDAVQIAFKRARAELEETSS